MFKRKTTLEDVLKIISKWSKDNDVCFYGSFMSFDKDSNVDEDRLIVYGSKECIEISLEELTKFIKEDKEEFLNW